MSTALIATNGDASVPDTLPDLQTNVARGINEFFFAEIENPRTRRAYMTAAADFFAFAKPHVGSNLGSVSAFHFSQWLETMKNRGLAPPTIKQRLAAVRMLFQSLTRQQVLPSNPVAVVKGPKYVVRRGKTPTLDGEELQQLLHAIDCCTLIGLRDRAMIATMAYSFARVSAVTQLDVGHVFHQKQRLWLRLSEKGGQCKDVPCHHHLQDYLSEWLERSSLGGQAAAPLFQTFTWAPVPAPQSPHAADAARDGAYDRRRVLSGRRMSQAMTWDMIQKRAREAGIKTAVCNHSFRAAGITAYLKNGGTIERAAAIAGHASTRTTQLYDRRPDDVTLDEIEKIRFA